MTTGSSESFLRFYESYARQPLDLKNMTPKEYGDFRERVNRETVRGRYMLFHENIEGYLNRQWRAFTVPRAGVWTLLSISAMLKSIHTFFKTFPNITSMRQLPSHPSYKLLGPMWSTFYAVRPLAWIYVSFRLTRWFANMCVNHWNGEDDLHYFWYYDSLYPDLLHDEEDMRYINFRYTDQKVVPDPLTAYYPYDDLKYNYFLTKKTGDAHVGN